MFSSRSLLAVIAIALPAAVSVMGQGSNASPPATVKAVQITTSVKEAEVGQQVKVTAETLAIARSKSYPRGNVRFVQGDAYHLPDWKERFSAAYAGFWWSHVPLSRMDSFIEKAARSVAPGALIAFLDKSMELGRCDRVPKIAAQVILEFLQGTINRQHITKGPRMTQEEFDALQTPYYVAARIVSKIQRTRKDEAAKGKLYQTTYLSLNHFLELLRSLLDPGCYWLRLKSAPPGVIESMEPAPAYVLGPHWEFLAWNAAEARLYPRIVELEGIITDVDEYDQPYIHAIPGDYGVVLGGDGGPEWPNVKWGRGGDGGVCNVSPDAFEVVTDGPWQAVGFKYPDEEV